MDITFSYHSRMLIFKGSIYVKSGEGLPEKIEKEYYLEKKKYYEEKKEEYKSPDKQKCLDKANAEIDKAKAGLNALGLDHEGKRVDGKHNKGINNSVVFYRDVKLSYNLDNKKVSIECIDFKVLNIFLENGEKSLIINSFFHFFGANKTEKSEGYKRLFKVGTYVSPPKISDEAVPSHSSSHEHPVGLLLANLIYYLSKKLIPEKKFNIHVNDNSHSTSDLELYYKCFSGKTSYYKSLGFTTLDEEKSAGETGVKWTGFESAKILIERIEKIFLNNTLNTEYKRQIEEKYKEFQTHGRKRGKKGSKKGKKRSGSRSSRKHRKSKKKE